MVHTVKARCEGWTISRQLCISQHRTDFIEIRNRQNRLGLEPHVSLFRVGLLLPNSSTGKKNLGTCPNPRGRGEEPYTKALPKPKHIHECVLVVDLSEARAKVPNHRHGRAGPLGARQTAGEDVAAAGIIANTIRGGGESSLISGWNPGARPRPPAARWRATRQCQAYETGLRTACQNCRRAPRPRTTRQELQ